MVKTSGAPQGGASDDSRRTVKHKRRKPKNATESSLTASNVLPKQVPGTQKVAQKSQSTTESAEPSLKDRSESAVEPKKSKPRPSKSARARIQAAKALLATESHPPSTGAVKSSPDVKVPVVSTAPVSISSPEAPSAKKTHSGAVSSKSTSVKASAPASNPTHKPPFKAAHSKSQTWKTAWMFKEINGAPVRTIDTTSLQLDNNQVCSTEGFETLCSYNWQNNGAIYVPGGPPKWTPPPLPTALAQDAGRHFLDQNAARVPKYPFEPAFRALSIMKPNTTLNAVDIIVNRNSLRKLLDLAAGKKPDAFCMGLNMINNTLVISRKERSAQYMIHGMPNAGYGHSFEHAFTTPDHDMDDSSSHHRVIRYRIGPLDCVVRFEVDAYYDDVETSGSDANPEPDTAADATDQLTAAIAKLKVAENPSSSSLSSTARPPRSADKPTIAVAKGTFIAASQLAEIKAKKLNRVSEAMPQLWFGRTPYFINGNHDKGTVHSVSVTHAGAQFAQWETANQEKLRKMVSLLVEIKKVVHGLKNGAAVLVYDVKGGLLKVYRARNDGAVLPGDIVAKYWGGLGQRPVGVGMV